MLVVLGNAGRDITYQVAALPRAGETIIALRVTNDLGGKGLNQAVAARRAGADLRFIAPVGRDGAADAIRHLLQAEAIDGGDLIMQDGATDSSVILVDDRGENSIVSDTRQAEALSVAELAPVLQLHGGDTLLLQGNLCEATTAAAIALANAAGARVIVNAAPMRPWLPGLPGRIDVLVANLLEAHAWAGVGWGDLGRVDLGRADLGTDLGETAPLDTIAERIEVPLIVVTLGGAGCRLLDRQGVGRTIAAPATAAVDTTGAGDVFTGTFVAEWLATGDPMRAATLAVHAASEKVTRHGTISAFPTAQAIARLRAGMRRGREA
jgi:ribokinase